MYFNIEEYVKEEKNKLKQEISTFPTQPTLVVIQCGNDMASNAYIKGKRKDCEEVGIKFIHEHIESDFVPNVGRKVNQYNSNPNVNGVIIQLPIPDCEVNFADIIDDAKDVDGFNTNSKFSPCTPKGIINWLKCKNINLDGANVVIIGRSDIVGKPLAKMMLEENATVTMCHSHTQSLTYHTYGADVIVSAVGKPNTIQPNMVNCTAVVVDVGINRDENNKLCGDVDHNCAKKCDVTPVPKGIGLTTRLALLQNVIAAYKLQNNC